MKPGCHPLPLLLLYSSKDPAGVNIAEKLRDLFDFEEVSENLWKHSKLPIFLTCTDKELIYLDGFNPPMKDVELLVFLSRHSSETGIPCLTVHVSGNPSSQALYGGRPKELAVAHPTFMSSALIYLDETRDSLSLNYQVSLEATHHGPSSISIPSFFIEIGSSIQQWKDFKAGEAIALSVMKTLEKPFDLPHSLGFGGGHYPPKITRYVLERRGAVGHIFPKYILAEGFDREMVFQAVSKTVGGYSRVVLDWKGVPGSVRPAIVSFAEEQGLELFKL